MEYASGGEVGDESCVAGKTEIVDHAKIMSTEREAVPQLISLTHVTPCCFSELLFILHLQMSIYVVGLQCPNADVMIRRDRWPLTPRGRSTRSAGKPCMIGKKNEGDMQHRIVLEQTAIFNVTFPPAVVSENMPCAIKR